MREDNARDGRKQKLLLAVFQGSQIVRRPEKRLAAIRQLNALEDDENLTVEQLADFLGKDLPGVLNWTRIENPAKGEVVSKSRQIESDENLARVKTWDGSFTLAALRDKEPVEQMARLDVAMRLGGRNSRHEVFEILLYCEKHFGVYDPALVAKLIENFRPDRNSTSSTEIFIEKMLSRLDDENYAWNPTRRKMMLRNLGKMAQAAKLENAARKIENRLISD